MQVIQTDVAIGQLYLDVLDVKGVVGDMDIGGQTFERQAGPLIEGEALDADIEVVVLELRQGEIGTQVAHSQVIDIEAARLARLIQHIISQFGLAHHNRFDLHVKRLGRLVVLGLEGIDDELHVGGAVLVEPRDMTVQADDLAIGDDDAAVGNQLLEADARTQFADGQQGVALLVIDQYLLEFQLVKRRNGH